MLLPILIERLPDMLRCFRHASHKACGQVMLLPVVIVVFALSHSQHPHKVMSRPPKSMKAVTVKGITVSSLCIVPGPSRATAALRSAA